jgi:aldose sugar dehydrogenase
VISNNNIQLMQLLITVLPALLLAPILHYSFAYAQQDDEMLEASKDSVVREEPTIKDPNLKVELVARGFEFPTSMTFLGPDDILVSEKNQGTVTRVLGGRISEEPLLDVNVATKAERGLLGIAAEINVTERNPYVFLYYTESERRDGDDLGGPSADEGNAPLGNRLYRYELVDNKLIAPKLLLNLPSTDLAVHNGGVIEIGPDNNLYLLVGSGAEDNKDSPESSDTKVLNIKGGKDPDGRGGILRVSQNGENVGSGLLGEITPLNIYYAYGIRNGFGMDFDPVTGNLWDTENGPRSGDEINLVEPEFNSGWMQVNGLASDDPEFDPADLEDFDGKGKYSDPEMAWVDSVGLTSLKFLGSKKLGEQYEYDMFVGDFHGGNIYDFDLNSDRKQLSLEGELEDKKSDNDGELEPVIFGQNFGAITDLQVGPDGYLYVLALYQGGDNCEGQEGTDCIPYSSDVEGTIFRISPS